MAIRLSLVIPTHNRAQYLKKSLPTFFNQSLIKKRFEIIVVDNKSTDNTSAVVNKLFSSFKGNFNYIREPNIGLHNARNRGILESKGDIVVFGDDDIEAEKDWLENILKEFDRNKNAGVVGGKILPIWGKKPEPWIFIDGTRKIHATLTFLDYGKKRKVLTNNYLWGCNFAVRKNLAIRAGGSHPDTYPDKLRYLSGDGEIGLAKKIKGFGFQIIYLPNAIVHHHVDVKRLDISYFINRRKRAAVEDVYSYIRNNDLTLNILRELMYTLARLVKVSTKPVQKSLDSTESKRYKIELAFYSEKLIQLLRVVTNKNLVKHIKRKDYFTELGINS